MSIISLESRVFDYTSMQSGAGLYVLLDHIPGCDEEYYRVTIEIDDFDGETVRIWEYPTDRVSVQDGMWDFIIKELIDRIDNGSLDYHW